MGRSCQCVLVCHVGCSSRVQRIQAVGHQAGHHVTPSPSPCVCVAVLCCAVGHQVAELQALSAKLTRDKTSLTAELTTLRDELGCCCCGAGGSTTRSPVASPIGTPGVIVVGLLLTLVCVFGRLSCMFVFGRGGSQGPHAGHCVQRAHRVAGVRGSFIAALPGIVRSAFQWPPCKQLQVMCQKQAPALLSRGHRQALHALSCTPLAPRRPHSC